jgi:uncharacterized membrane protein YgaE (UPF0421/DUF939 family)
MVDYETVGGVLKKGLYRLMGTCISGLYGLVIIYFSHNNVIIKMLAMIPLTFWYAKHYLDTPQSYILTIGVVTLTIALLNDNNLSVTILRIFNVILGNVATIIMIFIFFPTYAADQLNQSSLKVTQVLLEICQLIQKKDPNIEEFFKLEAKLGQEVNKVGQLISEAQHEHPFSHHDFSVYQELVLLSRRIVYLFHSILITRKNLSEVKVIEKRLKEMQEGFEKGRLEKTFTHDESSHLQMHLKNYEDCIEKILLRKNQ